MLGKFESGLDPFIYVSSIVQCPRDHYIIDTIYYVVRTN